MTHAQSPSGSFLFDHPTTLRAGTQISLSFGTWWLLFRGAGHVAQQGLVRNWQKGSETQFQFFLLGSLTSALHQKLPPGQDLGKGRWGEGYKTGRTAGFTLQLQLGHWVVAWGLGAGQSSKHESQKFCFSVFFLLLNVAKAQVPTLG